MIRDTDSLIAQQTEGDLLQGWNSQLHLAVGCAIVLGISVSRCGVAHHLQLRQQSKGFGLPAGDPSTHDAVPSCSLRCVR